MQINVAAASVNQIPLAWENNLQNLYCAIEEAKFAEVSMLCLPELAVCGYGCDDLFLGEDIYQRSLETVFALLQYTEGIVTAFGLPLKVEGRRYNAMCVVADGEIQGFVCKRFLANDGIHYEPRWFEPWPAGKVSSIEVDGKSYPVGDLVFNFGAATLGFEICHDAWVAERPLPSLHARGVNVVFNPSASHFAFGKYQYVQSLVENGVAASPVVYCYANLLGNEAGRAIYDGCTLIAWDKKIQAQGSRFSFVDTLVTDATASLLESKKAASDAGRVQCRFLVPESTVQSETVVLPDWMLDTTHTKEEEFSRAVALGLFDYMRKSHSRGFVVSASGGADSTAVACLVYAMLKLSIEELTLPMFKRKLSYLSLGEKLTEDEVIQELLTCVYQQTANNSDVTKEAAKVVAQALGAKFIDLDIESLVRGYVSLVEGALGEKLTWEKNDLALQNIQARVRSPSVWLLANIKNAILLCTSNRSEAAVGYATMDGDTSGGLSPIAGVDKPFVRSWLRWLEKTGPEGVGAIAELKLVNQQQPTAELRPKVSGKGQAQTDEQDLMPYEVLDFIERLVVCDKLPPVEVFPKLLASFSQYSPDELRNWTKKFYRLFAQNQWKRERYAPSFHLDEESLDPKTWLRFPILSGGFSLELEELE